MTIKTKKVKEYIDNIEQEQKENRLNWIEKVDDWREKYIDRSEQLNEQLEKLEKELEKKIFELEFSKGDNENIKSYYWGLVKEEKEKVKVLEEKNENTQISLLKEQYEKEIKILKSEIQGHLNIREFIYSQEEEARDRAEKLEKELEEREVFIKELEDEVKIIERSEKCNLDAIKKCEEFEANKNLEKIEGLKTELENEKETRQDFVRKLAEEIVENKKLTEKLNGEREKVKEEISKNLEKDEIIRKLEEKICLANNPLPKKSSKFKILKEKTRTKFQNLIEKVKHQSHELVARMEVKTK